MGRHRDDCAPGEPRPVNGSTRDRLRQGHEIHPGNMSMLFPVPAPVEMKVCRLRIADRSSRSPTCGGGTAPEHAPIVPARLADRELARITVRQVAERAGITKQAMGRIAAELESAGYVQIAVDPSDRRARVVTLTDAGQTPMADSFAVMAELEQRHALVMGQDGLTALLEGLRVFNAAMDPR